MKKQIYGLFLVALFVCSCLEDSTPSENQNTTNKVALLKVDYLTHTFEGGKELAFTPESDFTLETHYQPPGDFGSIQLRYAEVNQPLFDGTIVWMGLGQRSYPETLLEPNAFVTISTPIDMPDQSRFENVMYDEYAYYDEDLDYASLWHAIKHLRVVQDYFASNPNQNIDVFLYTPSVGVGNPEEWDYYILLKN